MAYKPNLILANDRFKVRGELAIIDEQRTYLTAAAAAAATTLTVENITGAAVNGYVVLGQFGEEETELVQIHASTAPSGTTITLSAAISYDHPESTVVQFIPYNQVEFSRATTSGGAKSVLATSAITVDQEFTLYNDTTNTTGFVYARFKNSTTSTYSEYSDEQAYGDFAYNAIGRIIDRFYSRANESDENFVKRSEILEWVREYIDNVNDLRLRWNHEEAATDKSNTTTTGGETFTLPSDIKYSAEKSIITISIEGEEPLIYISELDWTKKIVGVARSTLNGSVSAAAATITLYDSSNFPSSGTAYIAGDAFTFTGNSSNQLTGVSGILAHDSGSVVWDSNEIDAPKYYTILDGGGKIYPTPDTDFDNRPLVINYWQRLTQPDSENDVLPLPYVSPCINYLLMCYSDKKGENAASEKFSNRYREQIKQVIRNERTSQIQYFRSRE